MKIPTYSDVIDAIKKEHIKEISQITGISFAQIWKQKNNFHKDIGIVTAGKILDAQAMIEKRRK